jgi:hypothetical protein
MNFLIEIITIIYITVANCTTTFTNPSEVASDLYLERVSAGDTNDLISQQLLLNAGCCLNSILLMSSVVSCEGVKGKKQKSFCCWCGGGIPELIFVLRFIIWEIGFILVL